MCTDYLWVPIKNPEFSFVGIENNLQRESYSGFGLIFYIIWLSLSFVNVSAVCVCVCVYNIVLINNNHTKNTKTNIPVYANIYDI